VGPGCSSVSAGSRDASVSSSAVDAVPVTIVVRSPARSTQLVIPRSVRLRTTQARPSIVTVPFSRPSVTCRASQSGVAPRACRTEA